MSKNSIYKFLPIAEKAEYIQAYALLQQNKPVLQQMEITRPDGDMRMLELVATPRLLQKKFIGFFIVLHDITDQFIKEKHIEEARRLYQTIFMDAPIRIWELDHSVVKQEIDALRTQGVNDFLRHFNEHPEIIQRLAGLVKINAYNKLVEKRYANSSGRKKKIISLNQIFWEKSYPNFVQELMAIVEGRTANTYEITTRAADGSIRYSIIDWAVLPGHEKDYSRVIVSANDITTRKNAELELLASEAKFRLLAEHAGVGIIYTNPHGNIIFINSKSLATIGGNPQDYVGRDVKDIFGEKDGAMVKSRVEQAIHSTKSLVFESMFDSPIGKKWYHTTYTRILDNQGVCIGVQLISDDITLQKELESETQSLARFPEENPNPVMRFSRTGQLLYANKGSQEILEIWNYYQLKCVPAEYQVVLESSLAENQRELVDIHVGRRVFSLYFSPIQNMDYVNIYGRDITDLKNTQVELLKYSKGLEKIVEEKTRDLLEAQERLVRQERLATMGQLASGIGHELRNPLAVINNALYMLKLGSSDQDPTLREYLDIIDQEVAASNKIITDLLTFARIKPANLDRVDIPVLLDGLLLKFVPPETVRVVNDLAGQSVPVYVDQKQIEQVITNLLTNAYQSMPEGGQLTLRAEAGKKQLKVQFCDTGVGIAPGNIDKIFEPLFTTKAKGIGLGLTISKMLAEINGGKITVKSKLGEGSTFTLWLPISRGRE